MGRHSKIEWQGTKNYKVLKVILSNSKLNAEFSRLQETVSKHDISFNSHKSQISEITQKLQESVTQLISKSEKNEVLETKDEFFDLSYPHFPINSKNRYLIIFNDKWINRFLVNKLFVKGFFLF